MNNNEKRERQNLLFPPAASPKSDSKTVTAAIGIQKRLEDTRVSMSMEFLQVVYRCIDPAHRLLQGAIIDLASAATVLRNCMKEIKMFEAECGS